MRLAVYCAVLVITLGSVLAGLDWLSAPMPPMVDTEAGLHATPARAPVASVPVTSGPSATSNANIGAPIVAPGLTSPANQNAVVPPAAAAQAAPAVESAGAAPESQVNCNVSACTAAYRSFRASDCTYMPTAGVRKLCTK